MHYTQAEYAQVLAARFWFLTKSIKSIAKDYEISEDEIRAIQSSEEYRAAVETLIRTSRSPGNILKWIEKYPRSEMPAEFGKRMGLSKEVVSEMIERVEQDIRTRWNIGH